MIINECKQMSLSVIRFEKCLDLVKMVLKNFVLLLKSQKADNQNDKYEDCLAENGFSVKQCKTLIFNFRNLECLREKLSRPDEYEGIIFSSPRCVQAVHLAVKNKEENFLEQWQLKDNFVVGETTHTEALKRLRLNCMGKETGNAANLSHFILQGRTFIMIKNISHLITHSFSSFRTKTIYKAISVAAWQLKD